MRDETVISICSAWGGRRNAKFRNFFVSSNMKKNILLFCFYTDKFDRNSCKTDKRGQAKQTMFKYVRWRSVVIVQPPLIILFLCIDPFHATGLFRYPLKTSESQTFSDVFRGYRKRPVAWNVLIKRKKIANKEKGQVFGFVCFKEKRIEKLINCKLIYRTCDIPHF